MADGYAKAKGIGALAITGYSGETLDILTRAFSESVPLVVIFGKNEFQLPDERSQCFRKALSPAERLLD